MQACFLFLLVIIFPATTAAEGQDAIFTLNTADKPPYSTAAGTGLYDIIVARIFHSLKITIKINHLPSARSIENVDLGLDDAEYARIAGLEDQYPNLKRVNEKLIDFAFTAFSSSAATIRVDGWKSLKPYHVAFIRGWKIYETNVTGTKSLIMVSSEQELFGLLEKNRVDIILYERLRGADYMKKNRVSGIVSVEEPLAVRGMYLYVNKRHQSLVPELEKAIRALKQSGEYTSIVDSFLR